MKNIKEDFDMLTLEEAPWLKYLTIDEVTRERKLRNDTPKEIREKYEKHLRGRGRNTNGR